MAGARAADLDAFRNELLVWPRRVLRAGGRPGARLDPVAAISAVRTGTLPAASGRRGGYRVVPVEAMAVDTNAYTSAAGKPGRKPASLLPEGAVLSKTGAKLRRVKSGGELRLTGNRTVAVSGVVDDALLGGYEVALGRTLARRWASGRAAYLLVRPRGPVAGLQAELKKLLKGRSVHLVTPGDRPYVRSRRRLLAQVKARFGDFALPSLFRGRPDPAWTRATLVTGSCRCSGGCAASGWSSATWARPWPTSSASALAGWSTPAPSGARAAAGAEAAARRRGGKLSRDAWGIAVSLKVTGDERLIGAIARHGLVWGGGFARPEAQAR